MQSKRRLWEIIYLIKRKKYRLGPGAQQDDLCVLWRAVRMQQELLIHSVPVAKILFIYHP